MRGNESMSTGALTGNNRVFDPHEGNEGMVNSAVKVQLAGFSIPMRGNEMQLRTAYQRVLSGFSIPMRGNESPRAARRRRRDNCFRSP